MAQPRTKGFKFYLALAAGLTAAFIAVCAALARGPDRDLVFVREVPVESSVDAIHQSLWAVINWPRWFFSMADIKRVDISGNVYSMKDQTLEEGALLRFYVDPKKGLRRKFELLTRVTRYVPGREVTLIILEDSSGRLTQLFERLEWRIELVPAQGDSPARLRGTETARTRHWRSRLFSILSERILLNQVFYPDLLKLAAIKQPLSPNPYPPHGQ